MTESVIEVGDNLHIMTRRLFEGDIRRHFAGEIVAIQDSLVLVRGFTFILNMGTFEYRRLPEKRSRIFSLGDAGHIVNKIPRGTNIDTISYETIDDRLVISDGDGFVLSINEFGTNR